MLLHARRSEFCSKITKDCKKILVLPQNRKNAKSQAVAAQAPLPQQPNKKASLPSTPTTLVEKNNDKQGCQIFLCMYKIPK
jgi:hypothetical protein